MIEDVTTALQAFASTGNGFTLTLRDARFLGFIDWLDRALLNVDGNSDRWRSEDMLVVRVDDPTREEIPFTGFHLA
jgi:hypothetical protein